MLDVHASHESIHTWKGFFIHIAIIVIGLLIAISLRDRRVFPSSPVVAETREAFGASGRQHPALR